jgi:hypothetical protein
MKKYWIILLTALAPLRAAPQPGLDEMRQAQQNIGASFNPAWACAMVLAAILGTAGALRVYHNWQMGAPRIDAEVSAWFFAALFMLIAGVFLKAIFAI